VRNNTKVSSEPGSHLEAQYDSAGTRRQRECNNCKNRDSYDRMPANPNGSNLRAVGRDRRAT
jgi:hypothetical protein